MLQPGADAGNEDVIEKSGISKKKIEEPGPSWEKKSNNSIDGIAIIEGFG